MIETKPEYDSSCEYGCFLDSIRSNIPDRYYTVDVGFEFLVPVEFPDAYDGRFLITVYTFNKDHTVNEYMISLEEAEPRYIYGSDRLPDDIRDIVVNSIINNYKEGVEAINTECEREVIDPNRHMPDYSKL